MCLAAQELGQRLGLRVPGVAQLGVGGGALFHLDAVRERVADEKQLHRRTNVVP